MAQKNSTSTRSTLFFINKTSKSASLSNNRADQSTRKRINQHVQQTRDLDKERLDRIQRLRSPRITLFSPLTSTTSEPSSASTSTSPAYSSSYSSSYSPTSTNNTVDSVPAVAGEFGEDDPDDASCISDLARIIPTGSTGGHYAVCAVPLDNERYRILQYFVLEMFPAVSRSDTPAFFTGPAAPSQLAVLQMLRDCLSDEMHTYALLTAASARMKFLTRAPFSRTDLPERFADKAMSLLRLYLNQGRAVDERLILTIFFLCATESYRKEWTAVRTHQKMIKHLYTTHLGGFHNLNYHLRKMIWFQDRFQASATATAPVIEETWQHQDISAAVVTRLLKAIESSGQVVMGTAFADYTFQFFDPQFRRLLHEVAVLGCVFQCHWTEIKEIYPDRDWTNGRCHAILDELLLFQDLRSPGACEFAILLQDCVRLALITWVAFVGSPETGVAIQSVHDNIKIRVAVDARPLRGQFASLIEEIEHCVAEDQRQSIHRLCLWIAGLGALASELKENVDWFSLRFQELAAELNVDSWSEFSQIERTFFWLDRLEAVNDYQLTKILDGHLPDIDSAVSQTDRVYESGLV